MGAEKGERIKMSKKGPNTINNLRSFLNNLLADVVAGEADYEDVQKVTKVSNEIMKTYSFQHRVQKDINAGGKFTDDLVEFVSENNTLTGLNND
jgi:hypothetical protein